MVEQLFETTPEDVRQAFAEAIGSTAIGGLSRLTCPRQHWALEL